MDAADAGISGQVRDFYNRVPFPDFDLGKYNARYDLPAHANAYARALDLEIPSGSRVADVGCGTGQLSCLLGLKRREVVGFDFSEASLAKARALQERLGVEGVSFRQQDILALDWKGPPFDYVLCHGVLHHTADPRGGFERLLTLTRPGTWLAIGLYNAYGRAWLRARRALHRRRPVAEAVRRETAQEMLVKAEEDRSKQLSWYADQYEHPHESAHAVSEVIGWFRAHNVEYVSSLPPVEAFRPEGAVVRVFARRPAARWRHNPLAWRLKEFGWMWSLRRTGGYFILFGRRGA